MKFKLNKSLLYKDWKTTKWVAMLMFFCILYTKLFKLMSELNLQKSYLTQHGQMFTVRWFNNSLLYGSLYFVAMAALVCLLSLALFLNEKSTQSYGLIFSMPFTKKDIIKNKWFLGIAIIIGSFLINAILISFFYLANLKWINTSLNPFSDILKWFIMDSTVYILLFTVFLFFQTIMGNVVFSSITCALTLLVPRFLILIISDILRISFNLACDGKLLVKLNDIGNYLYIYNYNFANNQWYNTNAKNACDVYQILSYPNLSLKLLICWILIILFFALSLYCFSNRKLEFNNKIVCNSKLETVFKWCVSICAGLMVGAFVGLGYFNENIAVFSLSAILAAIVAYYILNKVIKAMA